MSRYMPYLHFFSGLTDTLVYIALGGGYATLFVATFLEGVPLLGIIIPGHVAIIAAGFLAAAGVLDIWIVMAVTLVGAIAGDFMSFYLGRRYGWPLIERLRPYFFLRDEHIEKAKRLLEAHTGKSLLIGRFNPITRGIMPFLVGASDTPASSFWGFNCLGAFLWVVSSVALGYVLGLGYHAASGIFGRLIVVAVIAGGLIIWGYRYVNARFHVFKVYEAFALILNLLSLFVLARMIQDAFAAQSFMAGFDIWVNGISAAIAAGSHGTAVSTVAGWVSAIGGLATVSTLTVLGGIALVAQKRWRSATILLFSVGATAFLVGWMKDFFLRARPLDSLVPSLATDPSFPSAHAAFAAAFFVATIYLLAPRVRSWVWRESFVALCVIATILIGISRIALNVHWATDVIAGWSLGIFCATGSILLVKYLGELVVGEPETLSLQTASTETTP